MGFRKKSVRRRGVTAVELALIAAPLFLFTFASVELCRCIMVVNTLEEAARSGCRVAVLSGATTSKIETAVTDILTSSGVSGSTTIVEPAQFNTAARYEPISVMVNVSFDDITWIPVPQFVGGMSFESSCTLPKESGS